MDLRIENNFLERYCPEPVRTFGENLKAVMKAKGVRTKDLAERLRLTPSVVSRMRKQTALPMSQTLLDLATELDASVEDFLEGVDARYDQSRHGSTGQRSSTTEFEIIDRARGNPRRDIPIVGDAEASTNGLISWDDAGMVRGEIEGWVPRSFGNRDQRSYALRVRGDSMTPRYDPGEILTVQPERVVRTGHYACVQLRSGERLIKRVFKVDGGWLLKSVNQHYPDLEVADAEVVAMHRVTDKTEVP